MRGGRSGRRRWITALGGLLLASGAALAALGVFAGRGASPGSAPGALPSGAPDVDGRIVAAARAPTVLPSPVRVVIPEIGVNAPVVRLGLNTDGTLQVPTNFSDAGWWSGGPFPGDVGPAVVVGHVSSRAGPGVFYRLRDLAMGDRVLIERRDHSLAVFRVTGRIEVPKTDFPTQRVYGAVRGAKLRLITCGGAFNYETGHFFDNIIVFASLVSVETA
jgi:hypothetical protein